MNLNHLKAFIKVVQTGSFKEAAKHLSVSQPAITQRIQTLEEYLKTRLLSKDHEGVQLTSHGRTLYEKSSSILALWDEVENEIWGTKVSGRLVFGASSIPSEYILPALLKTYRSFYPDVKLHLRISGTSEVIRWLRDRTLDIAITGEPATQEGIHSFPIMEDTMKVIIPVDLEWSECLQSMEVVMETDWIMREPDSDTRKTIEAFISQAGFDVSQLSISGQLESTESVIAAVEAGLGISAVSCLAANRAERLGRVKTIDIPGFSIHRKFYCSYRTDQQNQSVLSSFIKFIQERTPSC
jgi:DNA-binding transcriptional LysR family regulator